jgi:hypothetical protein
MNRFDVNVAGFQELKVKLLQLSNDKDKKKEILLLLRQVARPTLQASKVFVPVQRSFSNAKSRRTVIGGSLKQSLGLITGVKGNSKVNPTIYVGPRVFKGKKAEQSGRNTYGDGWYGHMVDQGHKIYNNTSLKGSITKKGRKRRVNERVTRKRTGLSKGFVPGQNFMRKAASATMNSANADAEKKLTKFIQRRINKLSN